MVTKKGLFKKTILIMLITCLTSLPLGTSFASNASDIQGTWAEPQITKWMDKGLVSGYPDGDFKPDHSITRAELIVLINKSFGFVDTEERSFKDVKASDWYYSSLAVANAAGYIQGYSDGLFRPNNNVTRQEIAVIVTKLLELSSSDSANKFSDTSESPAWSKGAIGSVFDKGIMSGYSDNTFHPEAFTTRAEAIVILDRSLTFKSDASSGSLSYDTAGTYGPVTGNEKVRQNVVINSPDVTLQNMTISGNLLLAEGIAEGEVFLKNVTVNGVTTVSGGGAHSVNFENASLTSVIIDKKTGTIRIVVEGSTDIKDLQVQSPATIESSSGVTIHTLTLSKMLLKDSEISLIGSFKNVIVLAQNIIIGVPQGSIQIININKDAGGNKLNNGARILSLIMNANTNVVGNGAVDHAVINSTGVTMEHAPRNLEAGKDVPSTVTVTIGGVNRAVATSTPVVTTPISPGSSGGQDGIATPTPIPAPVVTPTPTPAPVVTPTPTPAPVATPTPTPAPVVTPTPTPAPVVTPTPTPAPVVTPTLTPAPVATPTPTPAPVVTPTPTPAPVVTPTPTPAPVVTPTLTPAPVVTPTPTPAPVATPTPTPTPTPAPTPPSSPEPPTTPAPTPPGPIITPQPEHHNVNGTIIRADGKELFKEGILYIYEVENNMSIGYETKVINGKFGITLYDGDYQIRKISDLNSPEQISLFYIFKVTNGKPDPSSLDIIIPEGHEGTIRYQDGTSISNGSLSISTIDPNLSVNYSAPIIDGKFTLYLPDGNYLINNHNNYDTKEQAALHYTFKIVNGQTDPSQLAIIIPPKISGTITNMEGIPVPSGTLMVHRTDTQDIQGYFTQVREGEFSLYLPDGSYQADGFFVYSISNRISIDYKFTVDNGKTTPSPLAIAVPKGYKGKIQNADGSFFRDGLITVYKTNTDGTQSFYTASIYSGMFTLFLPDGTYQVSNISSGIENIRLNYSFTIANNQSEPKELNIIVPKKFVGTISSEDESEVQGGWLEIVSSGSESATKYFVKVENGEFNLYLPEGSYEVDKFTDLNQNQIPLSYSFTIGKDLSSPSSIHILLPLNNIIGTIKYTDGSNIADGLFFVISVDRESTFRVTLSVKDGRFGFYLPDGTYKVESHIDPTNNKYTLLDTIFTVVDGKSNPDPFVITVPSTEI